MLYRLGVASYRVPRYQAQNGSEGTPFMGCQEEDVMPASCPSGRQFDNSEELLARRVKRELKRP